MTGLMLQSKFYKWSNFSEIAKRSQSKFMLDLVDSASLLSRLKMEKIEVGKERWLHLVPVCFSFILKVV